MKTTDQKQLLMQRIQTLEIQQTIELNQLKTHCTILRLHQISNPICGKALSD
jgi:hypothetical protein